MITNFLTLVCFVGLQAHGAGLELDPPTAPSRAVVGQPFTLTYRIHWDGEPGDFQVSPAEADAFEGGTFSVRAEEAYSREGHHVVEQHVEVVADAPGSLTIPEVRVPYRESASDDTESPATYLVAPAMTVEVTEVRNTPAWVIPAVVVCVILVVAGAVWRMRRKKGADASATQTPAERVQSLLHEAQRHRLDGNHYAFYQTLVEVMSRAAGDDEARTLKEKLERRVREVGYQGTRPPDDELTGDYRDVERAVARWKEDLGS